MPLALLNLASRVDCPDLLNNSVTMSVVVIVQIDCRVDMAWDHLNTVPNLKPQRLVVVVLLPKQAAVFVAQWFVCIPRVLAFRKPAIRRERLQAAVDCHGARTLPAQNRGEDGQAVRVGRPNSIAVVSIHKDEGTGLDLGHAWHRDTELRRSCAAGRDNLDIKARVA